MKSLLSFVIVNYQSRKYLKKNLLSIFKRVQNVEYEIVIVNNDEKRLRKFIENKAKTIDDIDLRRIKVVEINKNVGFAGGCNAGVKKTQGEILCFLNPDTEIVSENISEIVSEFKKNDKVGIIGPKIIEKSGKIQKWIAGKELNLKKILKNNLGIIEDKKIWLSEKKQKVAWVTGAVLFARRNLFEKINGFDEKFFMYFEDIDLCKRIGESGFEILFFPTFTVQHLGGGSVKNRLVQKKAYYKSQDYYFQKWFGKRNVYLIKFLRKFHF